MKRMKPDEYRREAEQWVRRIEGFLPQYGEWNLYRIAREIEVLLKRKRIEAKKM